MLNVRGPLSLCLHAPLPPSLPAVLTAGDGRLHCLSPRGPLAECIMRLALAGRAIVLGAWCVREIALSLAHAMNYLLRHCSIGSL